jgi:hypothetical protein
MIARLVALGKEPGYLEGLPRDRLKAIYEQCSSTAAIDITPAPKLVVVPTPVAPVVPLTRIAQTVAGPIYEDCLKKLEAMRQHYDLDNEAEVPDRIELYAERIYASHSLPEAEAVVKRCQDKMFIHLMYLLSNGKISGNGNQRYNEKAAAKAENLAKWLLTKGQPENAAKQMARAQEIRRKMVEFKEVKEVA